MTEEKKDIRQEKKNRKCRICGTRQAVIRKYRLYVCRRCFKEIADSLGFKKFD